ncbi:hypothetical protein T4B_1469 [Trichinella pseudospiralis]|uniref:Uncharacterized protein n=1 Tax=Trichinella pseudospiralis TaxID=6337 RepID=A0A0V1JFU7_TRIPS|nr:hypothetical protein T4A_8053 [Trichinella pseudospiralis]KRZ33818.1 hypothetical protein T4B_1469 [Trichinella pseudospiralis]KRZ45894.1 hypothetical protein T4C_1104 [Trichinella pseudospiralis]
MPAEAERLHVEKQSGSYQHASLCNSMENPQYQLIPVSHIWNVERATAEVGNKEIQRPFEFEDKFSYLRSLMTGSGAIAVQGLPLNAANYEAARTTLAGKLSNREVIIEEHMKQL